MPLIPPYDNSAQTMKFSIGGLDDPLYSDLSTMKCVGRLQVRNISCHYTAVASPYLKDSDSIGDNICTAVASYSGRFVNNNVKLKANFRFNILTGLSLQKMKQ